MKLILVLILAFQNTIAFAQKPPFLVDHPQLRAKGLSEAQMQLMFNAQAEQCARRDMEALGVGAGGLPVGASSLTGGMAAQQQATGGQIYLARRIACMEAKGWVFTPTP